MIFILLYRNFIINITQQVFASSTKLYNSNCSKFLYTLAFRSKIYTYNNVFIFIYRFFIGFHKLTFFTWGSVLLIGIFSVYFKKKPIVRFLGAVLAALIFFIVTNLGVWLSGQYGYNFQGFVTCYFLALPFFNSTLISTLMTSLIIEAFIMYCDF